MTRYDWLLVRLQLGEELVSVFDRGILGQFADDVRMEGRAFGYFWIAQAQALVAALALLQLAMRQP